MPTLILVELDAILNLELIRSPNRPSNMGIDSQIRQRLAPERALGADVRLFGRQLAGEEWDDFHMDQLFTQTLVALDLPPTTPWSYLHECDSPDKAAKMLRALRDRAPQPEIGQWRMILLVGASDWSRTIAPLIDAVWMPQDRLEIAGLVDTGAVGGEVPQPSAPDRNPLHPLSPPDFPALEWPPQPRRTDNYISDIPAPFLRDPLLRIDPLEQLMRDRYRREKAMLTAMQADLARSPDDFNVLVRRWSYHIEMLGHLTATQQEATLAALGQDGWELVAVVNTSERPMWAYLKRVLVPAGPPDAPAEAG